MEKYYKWLATFLVMIGIFMTLLDTTIVDISLPKMMAELDTDTSGIQWVIITYLLSSAIGMSVIGWLGKRVSSRTIYLVGLAIFTGCSFLCGQAANLAQPFLKSLQEMLCWKCNFRCQRSIPLWHL